jgi:hypothetical protein
VEGNGNGAGAQHEGATLFDFKSDLEVDSVLAKELGENGTMLCDEDCSISLLRHNAHSCLLLWTRRLQCFDSDISAPLYPRCAGFRSTRRTKIIATIGPATCSEAMLEALAVQGMNVARLNMCHGTLDWHKTVVDRIRALNRDKG